MQHGIMHQFIQMKADKFKILQILVNNYQKGNHDIHDIYQVTFSPSTFSYLPNLQLAAKSLTNMEIWCQHNIHFENRSMWRDNNNVFKEFTT